MVETPLKKEELFKAQMPFFTKFREFLRMMVKHIDNMYICLSYGKKYSEWPHLSTIGPKREPSVEGMPDPRSLRQIYTWERKKIEFYEKGLVILQNAVDTFVCFPFLFSF
jgi:hypothetical protein